MRNLKKIAVVINLLILSNRASAQENRFISLSLDKTTQEDKTLVKVWVTDTISHDTVNARKLLVGEKINIAYGKEYMIIIETKKKWVYSFFIDFDRRYIPKNIVVCFNSKAKYTKKHRVSDVVVKSGTTSNIGLFSTRTKRRK